MRILLVDDHPELRQATRDLLEGAGHDVLEASGPEPARAIVERSPDAIDLLVTDLHMPAASEGLELARRVRGRRPALPVLVVSSDPHALEGVTLPGAFGRLVKPFTAEALFSTLETMASRAAAPVREPRTAEPRTAEPRTAEPSELRTISPAARPSAVSASRPTSWALAGAAALLVVAFAWIFLGRSAPPALPAPPVDDVRRGGVVEIVEPSGPLGASPGRFAWRAVDGGASYRLTLRDGLGAGLWESTLTATTEDTVENRLSDLELPVPAEVATRLAPHAAYFWRVEARDASGAVVAVSPSVRFRVIPRASDS